MLPILDPLVSPNAYYSSSPFLFWAIMTVGSRKYPSDPTLFGSLSTRVLKLVFSSLPIRPPSVQGIQALLLLLTWLLSVRLSRYNCGFPLGGYLIHSAIQIGLHNPISSQDFSKSAIVKLSEEDLRRRNELWAHCVVFYQRYHHPGFRKYGH